MLTVYSYLQIRRTVSFLLFVILAIPAVGIDCEESAFKHEMDKAESLSKAGKSDEAIGVYTNILSDNQLAATDSDRSRVYLNIGFVHINDQKFDMAIEALDRSIEFDPSCAEAYINRAIAYDHLENYPKAIENYKEGLRLNPSLGDPPGWIDRILYNIQEIATAKDRLRFLEEQAKSQPLKENKE